MLPAPTELRARERVVGYDGAPLYGVVLSAAALDRVQELAAVGGTPRWWLTVDGNRPLVITRDPEWFVDLERQIRQARGMP